MQEPTIITHDVRDALQSVRKAEGKPRIRAARIAVALDTLKTQAEVDHFTRLIRRDAHVQDVALLPETAWKMDGRNDLGHFDNRPERLADRVTIGTGDLLDLLGSESVTAWRIDWPSVTFHWGVAIFWTDGGNEYRAFSRDYQPTETYLSS